VEPTLANPQPAQKPRRTARRIAALVAVSTVTLAACGASAAGTRSTPTPSAPARTRATPRPGAVTGATHAPAATAVVGIVDFAFIPAALTVKAGTTVAWTNKDTIAHTVDFMTGGISSSALNQNEQFTHTFATPGTYGYICSIHPFMHGSVTVTT
jgi:plastocyanin